MNRLHVAGSALLLLASAAGAFAQAVAPPLTIDQIEKRVNEDSQKAKDDSETALIDPSLTSPLRSPRLQAVVSANRSDTSAALELSLASSETENYTFDAGLKLSGPISKNASEAKLATLEGLVDQAKISVNLHWLTPNPDKKFDMTVFVNALLAEFEAENPNAEKDRDSLELTDLSEKGQARVLNKIGLGRGIWLFGTDGTYAGPKTFEFAKSDTLANMQERHDGYSIAASVGWLPLQRGLPYFFGLTYRREEGYQEQESRQICRPFGVGGALECSDIVLGAPAKQVKDLGQLEARVYFRDGELALNPRITHNFAKDVTGVELPLYFLKDGNGALNGGLALGWRSDTDAVTLSAFVGSMKNPFAK